MLPVQWEVSKIADDCLTKGAHIKINGFELHVFVNGEGVVTFEKFFTSDTDAAAAKAIKAADDLLANNSRFNTKLKSDLERAIPYCEGLDNNIVEKADKIQQLRDLLAAL